MAQGRRLGSLALLVGLATCIHARSLSSHAAHVRSQVASLPLRERRIAATQLETVDPGDTALHVHASGVLFYADGGVKSGRKLAQAAAPVSNRVIAPSDTTTGTIDNVLLSLTPMRVRCSFIRRPSSPQPAGSHQFHLPQLPGGRGQQHGLECKRRRHTRSPR